MAKDAFSAWWDEDQLGQHSCWMSAEVDSYSVRWEYHQLPEEQHAVETAEQTWEEFLEQGSMPFCTTASREVDELVAAVKTRIVSRLEEAAQNGDVDARRLLDCCRSGVWPEYVSPEVGTGSVAVEAHVSVVCSPSSVSSGIR